MLPISKYIPKRGTDQDFFERLSAYIMQFDPAWIKRIKPASSQDINTLSILSGMEEKGIRLPAYYRIFLEKMGEADGGLLTCELGTSQLHEIIEWYQDQAEWDEEALHANYLIFYDEYMGAQTALEIGKSENPLVADASNGCVGDTYAQSFEKFLFQCAFEKYTKWSDSIGFCAEGSVLKETLAKNKHTGKRVFDLLETVINENNLEKMWISDEQHYIGFNEKVFVYVSHIQLDFGLYGYAAGGDKNAALSLAKQFSDKLGAALQ